MPNIPGKLPQQTPFSLDKRDPYWQTRIFTPEAGALALETLQTVKNQQLIPARFWTYHKIQFNPSASELLGELPDDGWYELVGLAHLANNTGGAIKSYFNLELIHWKNQQKTLRDYYVKWCSSGANPGANLTLSYNPEYAYSAGFSGDTNNLALPLPRYIAPPSTHIYSTKTGDIPFFGHFTMVWRRTSLVVPETLMLSA